MRHKRRFTIISLVLALSLIWFLGVDKSWFVEQCDDCLFGRDVVQYRIFGISIHENVIEYPSLVQCIASDLGVPCPHTNYKRYHKYRWWGLMEIANPAVSGISRVANNLDWYTDVAAKIKTMSLESPDVKEEFFNRAVLAKDKAYIKDFVAGLISQKSK